MAMNIRTILLQNGVNSVMIDAFNLITSSDSIMEFIGKNKGAMISLLKRNHAPENVIVFLNKHDGHRLSKRLFSACQGFTIHVECITVTYYA